MYSFKGNKANGISIEIRIKAKECYSEVMQLEWQERGTVCEDKLHLQEDC